MGEKKACSGNGTRAAMAALESISRGRCRISSTTQSGTRDLVDKSISEGRFELLKKRKKNCFFSVKSGAIQLLFRFGRVRVVTRFP